MLIACPFSLGRSFNKQVCIQAAVSAKHAVCNDIDSYMNCVGVAEPLASMCLFLYWLHSVRVRESVCVCLCVCVCVCVGAHTRRACLCEGSLSRAARDMISHLLSLVWASALHYLIGVWDGAPEAQTLTLLKLNDDYVYISLLIIK